MEKINEKRNMTKSKIVDYIMRQRVTSKVELAKQLNLSMPTVLTNVNELIEKGLILETGEYESTGGRKAKSLGLNKNYRYAIGIDITANHVGMVFINLSSELVKQVRIRLKFTSNVGYCSQLSERISEFIHDVKDTLKIQNTDDILGIGVSIPGIIDCQNNIIVKSHALQLENYSLSFIEQVLPFPTYFENDANAAMMAENTMKYKDAVFLSLNNTLGGAFCINGKLFPGQNQKAGEFGHMILIPKGKKCYCGKYGCADAYCAASVLTKQNEISLEHFMELVESADKEAVGQWEEYLDDLAVLISNLRMAYDTDIILGGEVGGYLANYMMQLGAKVLRYNGFDRDLSYLKNCTYQREASAVGVAKHFFCEFVQQI